MLVLMVFDHISPFVSVETAAVLHVLTRCVGAFFAYMSVEGLLYTRNQEKYLVRLWLAGVGMLLGNQVLNTFVFAPEYAVHNNIFLTLALGTTILYVIQRWQKTHGLGRLLCSACIMGLIIVSPMTEGGMILVPFMLISYFGRNNIWLRNSCWIVFAILLFFMSYVDDGDWQTTLTMLAMNSDFFFISIFPFLALYNRERGSNHPFFKYFFYVFYPVHLYLIALLATLMM